MPLSGNLSIVFTDDGSHTLYVPKLREHYHSTFGAITESQHIFIETGFRKALEQFMTHNLRITISPPSSILHRERSDLYPASEAQRPFIGNEATLTQHQERSGSELTVLEIGFGTGLNALLTQIEAEKQGISVHYTSIEAFPLEETIWSRLNYPQNFCSADYTRVYRRLHLVEWDREEEISKYFILHKIHQTVQESEMVPDRYHLIYYDAFGPEVQPELWSEAIFQKLYQAMKPGGILVTYSVKGTIVRALKAAGFKTEKLSGPPGKRHILRAVK
ncbi:MAG: tRNA (5-methylaminomethyl-2-thiouridine)(34)-methyltransferase MnmD [Bacteroidales bacterium]|jgi:tRNA U34 5-methylaminomethyl-2-thiouridine-forming methyltransferase MnmC|nr:tRNA (5-methylaminomethyl-2-thiouridine)(34)-methyltransferase MnmD [Bacteroidales bacterium]